MLLKQNILLRLGQLLNIDCANLNSKIETILGHDRNKITLIHNINSLDDVIPSEFVSTLETINDLIKLYFDCSENIKNIVLSIHSEKFINETKELDTDINIGFLNSVSELSSIEGTEVNNEKLNQLISELPIDSKFESFKDLVSKLDESQKNVYLKNLDGKKVAVTGSAGTGKTILATALAKKHSEDGKRVLLLTYNLKLASYIRDLLKDTDVDVSTAHQYFAFCLLDAKKNIHGNEALKNLDLLKDANFIEAHLSQGNSINFGLTSDWYEEKLALRLPQALKLTKDENLYETIIIDEMQLFPSWWLTNLYWSLKDTKKSTFAIFGDPLQDLYSLPELPSWFEENYNLTINYRNSKEIFTFMNKFVDLSNQKSSNISTQKVKNIEITNKDEAISTTVSELKEIQEKNNSMHKVTLLCSDNLFKKRILNNNYIEDLIDEGLTVETIRKYTGLENEIVVLVIPNMSNFPTSILSTKRKNYLYIAASRATTQLTVISQEGVLDRIISDD